MKPLKTLKQQLIDNHKEYKSDSDILHCFFSEKINKFCLEFNGKLFTYKTANGFIDKRNYFIDKYKLA